MFINEYSAAESWQKLSIQRFSFGLSHVLLIAVMRILWSSRCGWNPKCHQPLPAWPMVKNDVHWHLESHRSPFLGLQCVTFTDRNKHSIASCLLLSQTIAPSSSALSTWTGDSSPGFRARETSSPNWRWQDWTLTCCMLYLEHPQATSQAFLRVPWHSELIDRI